jgi:transposase-like protein
MLRRGQTTTFPERLNITERAAAGQSDPEIAAALGCSMWTVRKWRRRGQQQGRTGLSSQMGRPTTGPLAALPPGMREAILQMRRLHPVWGPTTLLAELQVDPRWTDQPLPSRSRIAALLSTEQLTRRYQKHSELPIPAIQPEGAPHDEWELVLQRDFTNAILATGQEVAYDGTDRQRTCVAADTRSDPTPQADLNASR